MSEKYAVMPMSDYTDACDVIQDRTGASSVQVLSGELSAKICEVYDKGRQAEYDEFWDKYQAKGTPIVYTYAFAGARWNDVTYNPKYEIKVKTAINSCFYYNNQITDTKVPIDMMSEAVNQIDYMFRGASYLKTIRLLKVQRSLVYTNVFVGCNRLENITFEGEIGTSISFADCPLLTVDSMMSVINHLVNYKGTADENKYSVKFHADAWSRLNAWWQDSEAMDNTIQEHIASLGWTTA